MINTEIYGKGDRIYLRRLELNDINKNYLSWLNDKKVNYYLETGHTPVSMTELRDYFNRVSNTENCIPIAIVCKKTDKHIGNLKLEPIDFKHKKATLGVLIGDKKYWGSGYGTDSLKVVLKYCFNNLNILRVNLGVYAEHKAAIKLYKKVGFVEEGVFRKANYHPPTDIFKDQLWLGILREDYKFF